MRNLLERATPELKKAIEDYSAAYSFTAESVKKDLEANTGVSYLNYLTVCRLADIAKFAGIEFRLENPWVHFPKD
jgi:hypothetical protein